MAQRIVIIGGHGKVARLLAPKLDLVGFAVDAMIRNPDQRRDIENAGASPVVLDIETASVDDLADVFSGATAIVFAAGAGGGSPERTQAVDHDAAVRTMQAAEQAGVKRYAIISYAGADDDYKKVSPDSSFYSYAKAKHDANAYLRETSLDYTILGPGKLTQEPATQCVTIADAHGQVADDSSNQKKETSRENVAEVIAYAIQHNAAVRQTVNFYDGDTPLAQALKQNA